MAHPEPNVAPSRHILDGAICELRILLLVDDDELGGDGEICLAESIIEGECHALEHSRVLTDPSPNFRTLKLMGELNGFPAVILVDSGATHNFICEKLVAAFGLTVATIRQLGIRLGMAAIFGSLSYVTIWFGKFYCQIDALVYDIVIDYVSCYKPLVTREGHVRGFKPNT
ncbi:retrotransposon-related protein [Tanacetum coccineum]